MTTAPAVTETVQHLSSAALGPFSTDWPYEQPTDVQVWLDPGTGVFAELDAGGDYLLTSTAPLTDGGSVQLSAALLPQPAGLWAPGARLAIVRSVSFDQPSSFGDTSDFDPATSEQSLDHVERQVQDLAAQAARAIVVPYGEGGFALPGLAERANRLPVFEPDGSIGVLQGDQGLVYLDALGEPSTLPVIQILQQIGVQITSDGLWHATDVLVSDGVWG